MAAATLLIECAARRLPAGPPGDEGRALGQAIRESGTGGGRTARGAQNGKREAPGTVTV
ncbi:hypothetical protein ACWCXB_06920 [Streptomyces sp. NPDC001514]